jgi:oligopeptide/dipeptide ABC transporter ATP-binding protein
MLERSAIAGDLGTGPHCDVLRRPGAGIVTEPVLDVIDLVKHYPVKSTAFRSRRVVHALDGVSFSLAKGETLALIGESGCGKSTLAKCLMRLVEPTRGTVRIAGRAIAAATRSELRESRRDMQIIFQDPFASLNPRRTVYQAVADPLRLHALCKPSERREKVEELLRFVGLSAEYIDRHPHELSGGQQQRVAIARALAVRPQVIICDEPVSALDVSVQAQVINLLLRLQDEFGVSYLFISHNLSLAVRFAHRVAVMYLGQIVELADAAEIARAVMHPYSEALFAAVPVADPGAARRVERRLTGDPPSPIDPPAGCRFQSRCPYRQEVCNSTAPPFKEIDGRFVRCHFAGEPGFMNGRQPAATGVVLEGLPT